MSIYLNLIKNLKNCLSWRRNYNNLLVLIVYNVIVKLGTLTKFRQFYLHRQHKIMTYNGECCDMMFVDVFLRNSTCATEIEIMHSSQGK